MSDRTTGVRLRAGAKTAVALAASAGMMLAFVVPSEAAERPAAAPAAPVVMASANGWGHYLDGSALGIPLQDVLALETAKAHYPGAGTEGPVLHPLDATVLNAINVNLGNGINLLGNNGILKLGAANQVAVTTPDGIAAPAGFPAGTVSYGASGTVNNNGAISVGTAGVPQSDATLDLTKLLGGAGIANTAISQLGVQLGAVAATASDENTLVPKGSYEIAGAKVIIKSPLVGQITSTLDTGLANISNAINSLTGPTGLLAGVINGLGPVTQILSSLGIASVTAQVTLTVDLQAALAPILDAPLQTADGGISIDLKKGTITVDLDKLDGGLNNLPPNTELLSSLVLGKITTGVTGLLTTLVNKIDDTLTSTLNSAVLHLNISAGVLTGLAPTGLSITFDGTLAQLADGSVKPAVTLKLLGLPLPLPVGDVVAGLLGSINNVLLGATGALGNLTSSLQTNVLTPLTTDLAPALSLIDKLVSLVANGQKTSDGAFTETALTLTLLPGATPLAQVNLAGATVGKDTLATKPGPAINLKAVGGDSMVNLTWTKPATDGGDPILGYNLYRGTTSGGESPTPINGSTLIKGLGYQDLSVTNGTTYYYIVKSVNRVGESVTSNEAHATPNAGVCPPPFLDVPSTNPFCMDIVWMKDNGITTGVTPTLYKPLNPTTRSQMAGFVYRQLNPGAADLSCTVKPFTDVDITQKFCGDITWLKDHGITGGYSDGSFHPAEPISRQALSAFMFRMNNLGMPDPTCTMSPFTDVPASSIFCGDITWMSTTGISYGYQNGTFRPQAQTTRQAMAGLVHRMVTILHP